MANLPNIKAFNEERRELMKIKNLNDEVILFTKQEAKDALVSYIGIELNLIKEVEDEVRSIVDIQLSIIAKRIEKHISDKMNDLTEKIVEASLTRVIEAEIIRRVDERINKIKNGL